MKNPQVRLGCLMLAACSLALFFKMTFASPTCSISVHCTSVLEQAALLDPEIAATLPEDGIVHHADAASFSEGETALALLQRELEGAAIEADFIPLSDSNAFHCRSVDGLSEGMCGEGSGWQFLVNGTPCDLPCNRYVLQKGDHIVLEYVCGT